MKMFILKKGRIMLNRKAIYVCSEREEDLAHEKINRKLNIVLLKEEIFIKIIKIDKKDNIEKLLKENINSTFRYYDILTHHERVKFNNDTYLVIYFIKYYNYLKKIINKVRTIDIKPYEFTTGFNTKSKGLNIVIKTFRENIYLVASIRNTIVYTKNFSEDEDINYYINSCLEQLREIFNIDSFELFIEGHLYDTKLHELTKNIKLIKDRVS